MTTQTPCQYSQQLLWHFVSIAKDYVETRFFANTFLNYFCKFICGRSIIFLSEKEQKSCETVPLSLKSETIKRLKGTVSWDFLPFFSFLKRFYLGPILTGRSGSANFFVCAKIFDIKVRNLCVRIVNDYADTQFLFFYYWYWICESTQLTFFPWLFL